jgi:hypothetical protein
MDERTAPAGRTQPARALELANRVRRVRSELRTRIANGQLSAADVILDCPRDIASMPIARLLTSQRGWGEARSRAFLGRVAVRENKSIGSLTERQRHAIASVLTRTATTADVAPSPHAQSADGLPRPKRRQHV